MDCDSPTDHIATRVAVIGSGLAGSACAAGLTLGDARVTLFEKSKNVGGRMATRRVRWVGDDGTEHSVSFDHGAQGFAPVRARFRAVMSRAMNSGCAAHWNPLVHAGLLGTAESGLVITPAMPALCRHLLGELTVHFSCTVRRLQRTADGAWFIAAEGMPLAGPFDQVVIAMPPAQAAVLVAGHHDDWAEALMAKRMEPCWTLMAVTDDVDWPWDMCEPASGPLARVLRNDRVPGRTAPRGMAVWTAHATPEWTTAHLEDDPQVVTGLLREALRAQLPTAGPGASAIRWHHANVQRWRYARPDPDAVATSSDGYLWDESLSLGVCGDFLAGAGIEAAWQSGDELADCMAASFERPASLVRVAETAR
jgi:predicted NAD/FAD-dependent oxidoreductase